MGVVRGSSRRSASGLCDNYYYEKQRRSSQSMLQRADGSDPVVQQHQVHVIYFDDEQRQRVKNMSAKIETIVAAVQHLKQSPPDEEI